MADVHVESMVGGTASAKLKSKAVAYNIPANQG